jgi:hypothetical protein
MVEYGEGVSQGAGGFSESHGGGQAVDAGANVASMVGGFVGDASATIATLPPVVVALGAAFLILASLMVLRRVL